MREINWNMTIEDILTESRLLLADIFEGTNYSIIRNPKSGEKMNNLYMSGIDGRIAYIVPKKQRRIFHLAFQTEYSHAVIASGVKSVELKDIKPGRYPNWRWIDNLTFDDLRVAVKAIVTH